MVKQNSSIWMSPGDALYKSYKNVKVTCYKTSWHDSWLHLAWPVQLAGWSLTPAPTQGNLIREEEHWVGRNVAIRERIRMWTWGWAERKLGEREERGKEQGVRSEEGWVDNGESEMQNVGALVTKTFHLVYLNTKSLLFQDWKRKRLSLLWHLLW